MALGRTGNWLLLKQRCYAPPLPVQPLPSHPPSTPDHTRAMIPPLITWPHGLEWEKNLKTPSVSLVSAWRKKQKGSIFPLSPPISFVFAVKTHFQSSLEVASDVWHQHILLGREIKGVENFWRRKVVSLVCQCQMHCAEPRTLMTFPYFESRLKPRTLQSNYNKAVFSNLCNVFKTLFSEVYYAIIFRLLLPKQFHWHAILRKQDGTILLGY